MIEPAACPGTPDGLHNLELVPQDDGTYQAKCTGCRYWLSHEGFKGFLEDSKNNRRRYVVAEAS